MIVSTMRAILNGTITSQQLQDHYLYLVGDREVIFYIGQALNPVVVSATSEQVFR